MGVGQVIGAGAAGTAGVATLIAAMMEGRSRDLESGQFVREQITTLGYPDVYADSIIDNGSLVRGWGMRTTQDGRRLLHPGMDIVLAQGQPTTYTGLRRGQGTYVKAARTGVVEHSGQLGGYGEAMLLRHPDGSSTFYGHLNDRLFPRGTIVQGGTPIGRLGRTSSRGRKPRDPAIQGTQRDPRTGNPNPVRRREGVPSSMGAHLHFSVHGLGARKLPATARFGVTTGIEGRFGSDPVQWAGGHGIRV
jgi:hypothetical protein